MPWLLVWLIVAVVGAGLALLLWPARIPAGGAWFWFCTLGLPTLGFGVIYGIALTHYEALYAQAAYRNAHRDTWLAERIGFAQQPLQILGTGFCLPFEEPGLGEIALCTEPLIPIQAPRNGISPLVHGCFLDTDPRLVFATDDQDLAHYGLTPEEHPDHKTKPNQPRPRRADPRVVALFEMALAPLIDTLRALSRSGKAQAPVVKVVTEPSTPRLQEAGIALHRAGLSMLSCEAALDTDGLMLIDTWLDAADKRALLVLAATWHEVPPAGSTEAAVAVLMAPLHARLPKTVRPIGTVHRPVHGPTEALPDVLAHALLWGKAEAATVAQAWITGFPPEDDSHLRTALTQAALTKVIEGNAQHHLDRLIGNAGAARPWLSLAAAVASGTVGPQLLLDANQSAQATLVHVNQTVFDDIVHD